MPALSSGRLKAAIVGLGARGRQWAREVDRAPGWEIAACVDVDEGALRRTDPSLPVPADLCFTGLEEALERVRCDAVIVATSADRHVAPCETALSRGLGVLVEKPFALELADAVRLVELAEGSGTPLLVAHNYRLLRSQRAARRLVSEGVLGRVAMAVCQYYNVGHGPDPHDHLDHQVLWRIGVHHLDALPHVLGQAITGVMATFSGPPWGAPQDATTLQALMTLDGGTRAVYTATYASSGHEFFEGGQEYYERLVGERATLHVFHRWLVLCERGRRPRLVRRGPRRSTEEAALLDQLSAALREGAEPEASARANLRTLAAARACIRSADEGRWVDPRDLLAEDV